MSREPIRHTLTWAALIVLAIGLLVTHYQLAPDVDQVGPAQHGTTSEVAP